MISAGIKVLLQEQQLTVPELSQRLSIPQPHIRAAVSELVFRDREVTCGPDGRFTLGVPPTTWPQGK